LELGEPDLGVWLARQFAQIVKLRM
jgi:hypothetical protein